MITIPLLTAVHGTLLYPCYDHRRREIEMAYQNVIQNAMTPADKPVAKKVRTPKARTNWKRI